LCGAGDSGLPVGSRLDFHQARQVGFKGIINVM